MIPIRQLSKLHGVARSRKCALLLERIELELSARGFPAAAEACGSELLAYALDLAAFLAESPESGAELAAAALRCLDLARSPAAPAAAFRAIDDLRHYLARASGQAPADWDLHDFRAQGAVAIGPNAATGPDGSSAAAACRRLPVSGTRVFLEDIRSPFNVGTILRTAEALGFEEVLLSPACADPRHPRAERSAMGAVDIVPWRRCPLEELPALGEVFALELGGAAIGDFDFPERGVLILGSEELGVSAGALALSEGRRVSIPMRGLKASINVAVAFGIAAQAWVSTL
jgi:TrmH family RNA methyltransferase